MGGPPRKTNPPVQDRGGAPEEKSSGKRYGFPREARLQLKREFDAVFREGAKGVTSGLVIYAMRNNAGRNRLGLVVGKKVGNAVRRNRIRRLLREAFRLQTLSLPKGYDLVCIPRAQRFPSGLEGLLPLFRDTVLEAVRRIAGKKEK